MVGTVFLRQYRVDTFLGKGSMGTVYLARNLKKPEVVVVKLMNREVTKDPGFRTLFDREIETLKQLNHPNIVGLLGYDFNDPHGPCVVMEFIPGVTLEALLTRHKRLPVEQVYRLLIPLCRALAYGHARQVIHRDLKPANLMVTDPDTPNESVKVMDFGLAQLAAKPHISLAKLQGKNSMDVCGTPVYLAPEGMRGDTIDHRVDIYSVGIMLYELLLGVPPFNYTDTMTVLNAHVNERPPRMARMRPDIVVPADVEAVVQRCLSKYPNERPQNGRELADEFSRAMGVRLTPEMFPPEEGAAPPAGTRPLESSRPIVPRNPRAMSQSFEAWMHEPIAVVKLRGFIEDVGGEVLQSEPGQIKVRIGHRPVEQPKPATAGSMLSSWFGKSAPVAAAPKPVPSTSLNMEIFLARKSPTQANHLELTVVATPPDRMPMSNLLEWQARCERIFKDLKAYLMAG
jgi:eukaryotic-like serine/threonine-protein kinase